MPSDIQHLNQSKHNFSFLETFYSGHQFNDWSITVAFYSVVHVVEIAIYRSNEIRYKGQKINISHSDELPRAASNAKIGGPDNFNTESLSGHTLRNIIIKENFSEISNSFMLLYRESKTARYRKYDFSDLEVQLIVKPAGL